MIEPWPFASKTTVTFWQSAFGASVSFTVTSNEQFAVFPEASVTTNVLVVVPTGKVAPEGRPAVCATVKVQLSFATFT